MNLIKVANETIRICKEAKYEAEGTQVVFPQGRYDSVELITPKMGEDLLAAEAKAKDSGKMCRIREWEEYYRFSRGVPVRFCFGLVLSEGCPWGM